MLDNSKNINIEVQEEHKTITDTEFSELIDKTEPKLSSFFIAFEQAFNTFKISYTNTKGMPVKGWLPWKTYQQQQLHPTHCKKIDTWITDFEHVLKIAKQRYNDESLLSYCKQVWNSDFTGTVFPYGPLGDVFSSRAFKYEIRGLLKKLEQKQLGSNTQQTENVFHLRRGSIERFEENKRLKNGITLKEMEKELNSNKEKLKQTETNLSNTQIEQNNMKNVIQSLSNELQKLTNSVTGELQNLKTDVNNHTELLKATKTHVEGSQQTIQEDLKTITTQVKEQTTLVKRDKEKQQWQETKHNQEKEYNHLKKGFTCPYSKKLLTDPVMYHPEGEATKVIILCDRNAAKQHHAQLQKNKPVLAKLSLNNVKQAIIYEVDPNSNFRENMQNFIKTFFEFITKDKEVIYTQEDIDVKVHNKI